MNSNIEATVFIDDHEHHVAVAASLGVHAIHFAGYEALLPALVDLGVAVEG